MDPTFIMFRFRRLDSFLMASTPSASTSSVKLKDRSSWRSSLAPPRTGGTLQAGAPFRILSFHEVKP